MTGSITRSERAPVLTPREREVVGLLASGLSGVEIATKLFLSPETVRTHVRNAMNRSEARTRAHLVASAAARGEIELEPRDEPPPPPTPDPAPAPAPPDPTEATPRQLIEHVLETAREMLAMDTAFVSDTRDGLQEYVATTGDSTSFGSGLTEAIPLEETYCELMLDGRIGNVVPDSSQEPELAELPLTSDADIGAYIGVPVVMRDGTVYGTFCCLSHEPEPLLQERDAQFMRVLARLIADLLERDKLEAEARQFAARAAHADVLVAALAARDGYTEEHSNAVVELAVAIADRLGLRGDQRAEVESVALLHDIGKIGVPDSILRKPGKLTEAEWAAMREHPAIGERIVACAPTLAHLAPAIRAEHERWDGGGYPDGLAGEAIPVASRIVLVADAYHAMTSDRPYRSAMPKTAAVEDLRRNAGGQFWPAAVDAAVAVVL